ncbi:hypothetical protein P8452_76613 [Trifolium repens]|nr:hypothetical protein P8452_76613 [Trifolium repens]
MEEPGLIVKSKRWSLTMENIEEKGKSKSIHGINMRILRAGKKKREILVIYCMELNLADYAALALILAWDACHGGIGPPVYLTVVHEYLTAEIDIVPTVGNSSLDSLHYSIKFPPLQIMEIKDIKLV